jgi:hypothetical protein
LLELGKIKGMLKWHQIPRKYRTDLTRLIADTEVEIDRDCDAGLEIRKPLSNAVLAAFDLAWSAPQSEKDEYET